MEVSVKAPAIQAAAVMAGFMAFLAEVGAERDTNQQAKTHWALDHYAARLRKQGGAAGRRQEPSRPQRARPAQSRLTARGHAARPRVGWRLRHAWNRHLFRWFENLVTPVSGERRPSRRRRASLRSSGPAPRACARTSSA